MTKNIARPLIAEVYRQIVTEATKHRKITGNLWMFITVPSLAETLDCSEESIRENILCLETSKFISVEKISDVTFRIIPLIDSSIEETPNEK